MQRPPPPRAAASTAHRPPVIKEEEEEDIIVLGDTDSDREDSAPSPAAAAAPAAAAEARRRPPASRPGRNRVLADSSDDDDPSGPMSPQPPAEPSGGGSAPEGDEDEEEEDMEEDNGVKLEPYEMGGDEDMYDGEYPEEAYGGEGEEDGEVWDNDDYPDPDAAAEVAGGEGLGGAGNVRGPADSADDAAAAIEGDEVMGEETACAAAEGPEGEGSMLFMPPFTYLAAVEHALQEEGGGPKGGFPLQVRILGQFQRVISNIQFQDADGNPLPGFSLEVVIEDGSFMCQAVLSHDPIYNLLGKLLFKPFSLPGDVRPWFCAKVECKTCITSCRRAPRAVNGLLWAKYEVVTLFLGQLPSFLMQLLSFRSISIL